jgi:hypothetical protein
VDTINELNTKTFSPEVKNRLAIIEEKRLKMVKKVKTTWLVFACVILSLGGHAYLSGREDLYLVYGIIVVVTLILSIVITYFSRGKITKEFKLNVILPSINNRENINYAHDKSVTKYEFINSEIYSAGKVDRFKGEDLFYGKRGKTTYKFSEVHAEERRTRTDSKGRTKTYYVTVFKGIFMMADFNKHLTTTTRVIKGGDGFFEKLFAGKTKVTLENPIFEKIFNTYSTNQVEARYILSPAMMERILELQELFDTKINLSFTGNHVYLAINIYTNHFEPKLGKKIDVKQLERIYQEIEACLKIIDTLDLNTRIWTKN